MCVRTQPPMPQRRQPRFQKTAKRLFLRGCAFLWLAPALIAFSRSPASAAKQHVLRTIQQIYSQSKAEAAYDHPVELDAVVTYSDGPWRQLFVQDATGDTFLDVPADSPTYRPGTRVRVEAVSSPRGNGIKITKVVVHVVGRGAPPAATAESVADLEVGQERSNWVVTQGVLHPCPEPSERACYRIFAGKKMVYIQVRQPMDPAAQKLVGAVVSVRGVAASHLNKAGQRDTTQMFTDSLKEFDILSPSLLPNSPATPIRSITSDDADVSIVRQVRIRGRIIWQTRGQALVRDATGTIFVQFLSSSFLQIGDTVDVVGFPAHGEWGLELSDAALHLSVDEMNSVSLALSRVTAEDVLNGSYQGRRVELKARLVSQTNLATRTVYHLRGNDVTFDAICLNGNQAGQSPDIPRGSIVELTGIAWRGAGNNASSAAFTILLQSPTDMVLQTDEIWLTWQRALGILALIAVCMLVPLLWIKQLRRTVQKQTAIIHRNYESKLQLDVRFRRVIERNLAAVYTVDASGAIIECNAAFANMLGVESREDLIGRRCLEFEAEPGQMDILGQALKEGMLSNCETSMQRNDGEIVHLLMNVTPVETPQGPVYETTAIDITQLRLNQVELQKAKDAAVFDSLNDALTGLPNRRYLQENLPSLLSKAKARHEIVALLFVDLDGFKAVNDSLGHAVGDAVLVQVASSLRSMVRQGDSLARLGGDEFMVILSDIQHVDTAVSVAESLLEAVSLPQHVANHLLSIGASIGVSIFPGDTANADDLIHHADCAMYAAKCAGKNRIVRYSPEMGSFARERLILENQLRGAVARNEIFLHYQPEFDLADLRLVRFEALARWTHPEMGVVAPLKFIPIAEETGMIHELGAYLLEKACTEAVRWQEKGRTQLAVNVSSLQFHHQGFVEEILATLQRTGLDPELLQIEFTESVMLSNADETEAVMLRLRSAGIQLAVDDFGTGYSNLSLLTELPFDFLKIDRSFVRHLDSRPGAETMMRTLIMLAHNFGMRVIVEGVESPQQLELIRACGANEVQGFLLGRPTADPLRLLLEEVSVK